MTLQCSSCGSRALSITDQSYSEKIAFEAYRCDNCGATGSLRMRDGSPAGEDLSGCLEATL